MAIRKPRIVAASHPKSDWRTFTTSNYCGSDFVKTEYLFGLSTRECQVPEWFKTPFGYVSRAFCIESEKSVIIIQCCLKGVATKDTDLYFIYPVDRKMELFKKHRELIQELMNRFDWIHIDSLGAFHTEWEKGNKHDRDSYFNTIVYEMSNLYYEWSMFPNEDTYEEVAKLISAKGKSDRVNRFHEEKKYEDRIKELREEIVSLQKEIKENEEDLNRLYEEAADGMNLLEEKGYKKMIDSPLKEREEDDRLCLIHPKDLDKYGIHYGIIDDGNYTSY